MKTIIPPLAFSLWAVPLGAGPIDFETFDARDRYSAVLLQQGRVQVDADWNEEEAGPIAQGQPFGIFRFAFDPAAVQPIVTGGIAGGLAVGAAPEGTLGGDQGFSLTLGPGTALDAFGAEIALEPSAGAIQPGMFRLILWCGDIPCAAAANSGPIEADRLFLGIVAAPGFDFDRVTVEAVTPRDPSGEPIGAVPGWQVQAISFAAVPEPGTVVLAAAGLAALAAARRRRQA